MARVVHFEVPVDDPERAGAFYSTLFGWDADTSSEEGYWLAATGPLEEPGVDGAFIRRSELHDAPVVIVGVDSVDDCLAVAERVGAEVLVGKHTIPTVGYSAYLRDTEGNVVGIFQPVEETGSELTGV